MRAALNAWLPVALWMALLFAASTDLGGTRHTSRLLVPFLRWLAPDMAPRTLNKVHLAVRKAGHAVAYALLAGLLWRARRWHGSAEPRGWSLGDARFAFVLSVLYAATDEWHQTFTATRQGSLADVALDAGGAVLGLTAIWCWRRWRSV